ncbi:MAG: alpha/beta hydrolase [Cyanobacteria bacterium P01_H01_bin.119]
MPYIAVNGVEHFYQWVSGSFDRAKPTMVFVHGWGGSCRYWQSTAEALSDQFNGLLYDMRGFGRSQAKGDADKSEQDYELVTFADDLAELLNQLKLDKVYLNAHSMGASVAAFFLNRYGDRVEKAILTCNGIFEYDKAAFEAFYRFGGYVVAFRPKWLAKVPLAPRIFMARFLHQAVPREIKQAFLEDFLAADYDTALGTIFTAVSKTAVDTMPQEFAQISVPTLLVSGQYDQITPAKLGAEAAALNSKIEYLLVPSTGHFPMLEDAATYLEGVNHFLATA